MRRDEALRQPSNLGTRGGDRRLNCEEPGHHPLDIAVHCRFLLVEGDGRDGAGRIGADAGQFAQAVERIGEGAGFRDRLGAGLEVAGAGVIAEAGPSRHDALLRRRREGLHGGEAFEKAQEVRFDRRDRGLLQHHLGQPDPIGVRSFPRQGAPREDAAMPVVP